MPFYAERFSAAYHLDVNPLGIFLKRAVTRLVWLQPSEPVGVRRGSFQ